MVLQLLPCLSGTGDAQISLGQRLPLAGAVIVSTPQEVALLDARRGANMFKQVRLCWGTNYDTAWPFVALWCTL